MDPPTHIIDPEGEAIIWLRQGHDVTPFVEWDEWMTADGCSDPPPEPSDDIQNIVEEVGNSDSLATTTQRKGKRGKKNKKNRCASSPLRFRTRQSAAEEPVEEPEAVIEEPEAVIEEPEAVIEEPEAVIEEPEAVIEEPEPAVDTDECCFRIQVSAKHLISASSVFNKIFTGPWKESVTYFQKGSVEISAEGWDIEALLVLLHVIHNQQSRVPRKLSLDMLAKVAVLVDYYDCKEAVDMWSEIWVDRLAGEIPKTYS